MAEDVTALRRRIGYVIQQVGLFPHLTVGRNVAVVPALVGWSKERQRARTDELLSLVGPGPGPVSRPLPVAALRRGAPARRRGQGAGRRPAADAHGRALRGGRPDRSRAAPGRVPAPAARAGQDDPLRDPRHRRGDQDGRPDRGHGGGRPAGPVRAAGRDPGPPGVRLRGPLRGRRIGVSSGSRCGTSPTSSRSRPAGDRRTADVPPRDQAPRRALSILLVADTRGGVALDEAGRPRGFVTVDAIASALARTDLRGRARAPAAMSGEPLVRWDWLFAHLGPIADRIGQHLVSDCDRRRHRFRHLVRPGRALDQAAAAVPDRDRAGHGRLHDPELRPVRGARRHHRHLGPDRGDPARPVHVRSSSCRTSWPASTPSRWTCWTPPTAWASPRGQRWWRVELPLAVPLIVAGLRLATRLDHRPGDRLGDPRATASAAWATTSSTATTATSRPRSSSAACSRSAWPCVADLGFVLLQRSPDAVGARSSGGALMDLIAATAQWLADPLHWQGPNGIPARLFEHVALSARLTRPAALVAMPLGLWIGHTGRFSWLVVELRQRLARPAVVRRHRAPRAVHHACSTPTSASRSIPTLIAMIVLAGPPILVNAYQGIAGVDRDLVEAARAMGMRERQILTGVELPIAVPVHRDGDPLGGGPGHRHRHARGHLRVRGPGPLHRPGRRQPGRRRAVRRESCSWPRWPWRPSALFLLLERRLVSPGLSSRTAG